MSEVRVQLNQKNNVITLVMSLIIIVSNIIFTPNYFFLGLGILLFVIAMLVFIATKKEHIALIIDEEGIAMRAINRKENKLYYTQIDSFHYSKFPIKMIIVNFVNNKGKKKQMSIPNGYNIKLTEIYDHMDKFFNNNKTKIELDTEYSDL